MSSKPPWRDGSTRASGTKLLPEFVELARRRAQLAGRRYPNLVDNMYAAQEQARLTKAGRPPKRRP